MAEHVRRKRYAGKYPRRYEDRYKEHDPGRWPDVSERVRAKGNTPAGTHVPVLVASVLRALRPTAGQVVCDCTLGFGGHAAELIRGIGPGGVLVGIDVDAAQLARTRERLAPAALAAGVALRLHRTNFAGIAGIAAAEAPEGGFDAVLADLGVSSMQVDDPSRGFSFRRDGPLDMRMDDRLPRTAADLLAILPEAEIAAILRDFGDEPDAAALARAIVAARARGAAPRGTRELTALVLQAKGIDSRRDRGGGGSRAPGQPPEQGGLHPAALAFQALRMAVNDEPGALVRFLNAIPGCLRPGGRLAVISFHSGEDRLVKLSFRDGLRGGVYSDLAADPVRPSAEEVRANARASSAKLRWAVKA